jgi:lactaldehyde dehydrogenase/glycolaldehyde dehydrogenase
MDKHSDIGPKVSRLELEQMESMVRKAIDQGCKVELGARRPTGGRFAKGHWYEPTILTGATNDMDIMREEIFGVVSPIMRIGSYEEALQLANDSDYGLAAFLFTRDMRRIQRAVLELEFGEIYVNRPMGEQRQGFHNGLKLSGTGGEDGKYGMENYLEKKTFYVNFG